LQGGRCHFCSEDFSDNWVSLQGVVALVCDDCIHEITGKLPEVTRPKQFNHACEALGWYFSGIPRGQLVATSQQFLGHMRADVQAAVDRLLSVSLIRFFGIHEQQRYETLTFAALTGDARGAQMIAPAQYNEVDIGESAPIKCLNNSLWLCQTDGPCYAVVLSSHREYGYETGTRIEIAVPAGAVGGESYNAASLSWSERSARRAPIAARTCRSIATRITAGATGTKVHKLPPVDRSDVILPAATPKLLDRNVLSFVESRDAPRRLGQSTRKGILLYGPPGTGKTHTIRYRATNFPGHTRLIITAKQVTWLGAYEPGAPPAAVHGYIEGVDLIARDREQMGSCEEPLLNKLHNEMDGLKEDADILLVLATNRPEQLEGALAGRPGRIDQAIEVPLPDEIGRGKLVRLYGKGLPLDQTVIGEVARRTEGVSAAFIEELMPAHRARRYYARRRQLSHFSRHRRSA
jgi:hypothetical protein